jgi:hypothetical protein
LQRKDIKSVDFLHTSELGDSQRAFDLIKYLSIIVEISTIQFEEALTLR